MSYNGGTVGRFSFFIENRSSIVHEPMIFKHVSIVAIKDNMVYQWKQSFIPDIDLFPFQIEQNVFDLI